MEISPNKVKRIGLVALPVVLFVLLYWWWDPSLTRSDREFRDHVGDVNQVSLGWAKTMRIKNPDGDFSARPHIKELFTWSGAEAKDLVQRLRFDSPYSNGNRQSKNENVRGYTSRWEHDPDGYLQFNFDSPDGSAVTMFLHHGHFMAYGNEGGQMTRFDAPSPWGYDGVSLHQSTKSYLKKLLKPYNIPTELIDGKKSSVISN